MGESIASGGSLEVSVSFGKFENDSLSWEKWSTFSPNKYLEEVEKCATPGSVAQKKAYFEAHYKKIAARKSELLDQGKLVEHDSVKSEDPCSGDGIGDTESVNYEDYMHENKRSAQAADKDSELPGEMNESLLLEESGEDYVFPVKDQSPSLDGIEKEPETGVQYPVSDKHDDNVLADEVKEEIPAGPPDAMELKQNSENKKGIAPRVQEKKAELNLQKKPRKIRPANDEKDVAKVPRKMGSSVTKSPQISTPKVSKGTSVLRSSTDQGRGFSLPRSKNSSTVEAKKVMPKSLHMSISLGPSLPAASFNTSRRSLIVEKMGEKEIVKRAFRSLHNSASQSKSFSEERSPSHKPAPFLVTEQRASTSITNRKENQKPVKPGIAAQKATDAASSLFGSRSNDRAEKRKEFQKKLAGKTDAKEAERTRLQLKYKEEKEVGIQKLRKNLNFKATPLPSFYRGLSKSKAIKKTGGLQEEIHA